MLSRDAEEGSQTSAKSADSGRHRQGRNAAVIQAQQTSRKPWCGALKNASQIHFHHRIFGEVSQVWWLV